jgi:putative nucleotidyltransferase with HDIG domain
VAIDVSRRVNNRITRYSPGGNLDHTAKLYRAMAAIRHPQVMAHTDRVALLAEKVAQAMGKDTKAAFFAGLLHDFGKIVLPDTLFDGHNISADEYTNIKSHAISGFDILGEFHMFTALCAGLHHALYNRGYGLTIDDFPSGITLPLIKKVLEIASIVSICDFIDAYTHRKTKLKHSPASQGKAQGQSLRELLLAQYPGDANIIDLALKTNCEFAPAD